MTAPGKGPPGKGPPGKWPRTTPREQTLPERIGQEIAALRSNPRRAALVLSAAAVGLVLLGWAWQHRSPETWIEVSTAQLQVALGTPQQLSVALKRQPRFMGRGQARSVAATIQLISFPQALDVAPTTVVSTVAAPEAAFTVTGRRAGEEELIFAASNTPTVERSWRTASMKAVVVKANP